MLPTLEAVSALRLPPRNIEDRVNEFGTFRVICTAFISEAD